MNINKRLIALVFSFEELNTNVLWNSILFNLKFSNNTNEVKYIAYAPKGFKSLFFCADEVVEIPPKYLEFKSYQEVSEYVKEKKNYKFEQIIKKFIILFKIQNKLLLNLLFLIRTPRAKKYLTRRIMKYVRHDLESKMKSFNETNGIGNFSIVHVQDFLRITEEYNLFIDSFDLTSSYKYLFEEHKRAIENGIIDCWQERFNTELILNKKIVLRSRNYEKKQPHSNTKLEQVTPIIRYLLKRNYTIINIGTPVLHLEFANEDFGNSYQEFNAVLSIDEEFSLLKCPVISIADAGLFTLLSCIPLPIIALTGEWSTFLGCDLFEARRKFGLNFDLEFDPHRSPEEIALYVEQLQKGIKSVRVN